MTEAPATTKPASSGGPAFLRSRMIRGLLIVVGIAIVLVLVIWFVFQQMRASRSLPIVVQPYPGAVSLERREGRGINTQVENVIYATAANVEDVYNFYVSAFGEQKSGQTDQGCILFEQAGAEKAARCLVDNSQDDQTQRLSITITRDAPAGRTLIEVEREWAQ